MPGHPAVKVGAGHKKRFEAWMRAAIEAEGIADGASLARQMLLLLDGAFAVPLLHREPAYIDAAGDAAHAFLTAAFAAQHGETASSDGS